MSENNKECKEEYGKKKGHEDNKKYEGETEKKKEYKREGMNQYIVLEQEEESQLEVMMLSQNQPPNLLPIEIRNQDGHTYFYYNITNKKSLEKLTEKKAFSYMEIKKLFESVAEAIEMTREYLLDADSLLLEEDMIYKAQQYHFVYFPGRKSNIVEQIQNLVAYLMDKIDHKDKDAVVYIYGLYRVIREGNFDIPYLKTLEQKKEENPYHKIMEEHEREKKRMEELIYQEKYENRREELLSGESKKDEEEIQKNTIRTEKYIREDGRKEIKGETVREKVRKENRLLSNPIFRFGIVVLFGIVLIYEGCYIYGKTVSIEMQALCICTFFGFVVYLIFLFWWMREKQEKKRVKNVFNKLRDDKNKKE